MDEELEGLRHHPARHAPDVHVLGDLLSRSPSTRRCSSGSSGLPLYHGIELIRSLTTGTVGAMQLVNVAYLVAHGARRHGDRLAPHRRAAAEVGARQPRPTEDRGAVAARIACRARPADAADAAEVVVEPLPAPDRPPAGLQLRERRLVDAGLRVDDVRGGVDARARDRVLGCEALVEDAGEHRRERRAQPRRAGGPDREHEPRRRRRPATAPSCSRGGLPAAGRRTRCPTRRGGCSAARRARGPRRPRRPRASG